MTESVEIMVPRPMSPVGCDSQSRGKWTHSLARSEEGKVAGALKAEGSIRQFGRGEIIAGPNERSRRVGLIRAGRAKRYRTSLTGREIILTELSAGCIFGMEWLDPGARSETITEVVTVQLAALCVETDRFHHLVESNPAVASAATFSLLRLLAEEEELAEELAFASVVERVAHYIAAQLPAQFGPRFRVEHDAVARRLGLRREQVSKAMKLLAAEGLVKVVSAGRVLVHADREALATR